MGSAVIFICLSPKAVDEVAACLYKERPYCVCIDHGLIPQPKGEAVPDKEKLTIMVGDLSWIRYPPVCSQQCHLNRCVYLFFYRFHRRCSTARIVWSVVVGAWR